MERVERARRRLTSALPDAGTASELLTTVQRALAPDVPADLWCALLLDPATVLPTGGVHDGGVSPERMPRLLELEFTGDDFNHFTDLAADRRAADTLAHATEGDNERSARFRDVFAPEGIRDELRVLFRDASGPWGALVLMRGTDVRDFDREDVALVSTLADEVARAIRRTLLLAEVEQRADADAPALALVDVGPPLVVRHAGDAAERWFAAIDDGTAHRLPYSLHSLALRAHRSRTRELARVRTRGGRWLTVHAEPVGTDGTVSLILEPSRPHEIAQVLSAAYGLTPREAEVVRLVASGSSNAEIARVLGVTRYTVQDHLKRLFEKVGVVSRTELVSKLYFDHYHRAAPAGAPPA